MLKHIVMWKLHEQFNGRTKSENIKILKEKLEGLMGVVPELKFVEFGINEGEDKMAYDAVLISHFENFDALERYKIHPEHLKISGFCRDVRESRVVIDYFF